MLKKFVEWAENNNWIIILNQKSTDLPEDIKKRYHIPEQWYHFVCNLKKCENLSNTKWFLTPNDYMSHEEDNQVFRWNEFEKLSLEWTNNDSNVVLYWDKHIPIFLSVDGEYYYYAINTENGSIVEGFEPEFENSSVVADDFNTFISKIITGEIAL